MIILAKINSILANNLSCTCCQQPTGYQTVTWDRPQFLRPISVLPWSQLLPSNSHTLPKTNDKNTWKNHGKMVQTSHFLNQKGPFFEKTRNVHFRGVINALEYLGFFSSFINRVILNWNHGAMGPMGSSNLRAVVWVNFFRPKNGGIFLTVEYLWGRFVGVCCVRWARKKRLNTSSLWTLIG